MRAPNIQLYTHKPLEIHGITDGARLRIKANDGRELYNIIPDNIRVHLPIMPKDYPVSISIRKVGYVSLHLRGLLNGKLEAV